MPPKGVGANVVAVAYKVQGLTLVLYGQFQSHFNVLSKNNKTRNTKILILERSLIHHLVD